MIRTSLQGRAGDTFQKILTLQDADEAAVDLTGCSVEWSLRSGDTTHQYTDTQISITDAAAGQVTMVLTPTETRDLAGVVWAYEVTITFSDTTRETVLQGTLSFGREVVE